MELFDDDLRPHTRLQEPAAAVVARPAPRPAAPPTGPVLLAVDGNSLAHRAFHAYHRHRGGAYGFMALLTAVADRVRPQGLIVGFDCRQRSHRRELWDGYKAQRPAKDPALHALLDELPATLAALGIPVHQPEGWEADDVLGSAAAAAEATPGWRTVLATSDRDAFSLVTARTTVLQLRDGMDRAVDVTSGWVRRRYRVGADQYVELSALCGDVSDNLRGIPGIGRVKGAALLRAYPTVAAAAADPMGCRSVLGAGPGQALLDDLSEPDSRFRRNVALITIRRDLPVDVEGCRLRLPPEDVALRAGPLGLGDLATRLAVALGGRTDLPPPPEQAP